MWFSTYRPAHMRPDRAPYPFQFAVFRDHDHHVLFEVSSERFSFHNLPHVGLVRIVAKEEKVGEHISNEDIGHL